ncbi:hypothetical protein EJ07DRAFT_156914 [Lizonia empirigonia]|nr:hypothetical protein EJ07DRAFT_156914 [Lizonia empirigonia]
MQFSIIALILSAALAVSAAPAPVTNAESLAPNVLSKRTCGTLTGTKLKVCQEVCKVACTAITLGVARAACKAACDAPVRAVEEEADEKFATHSVAHKICDAAPC